MTWIDAAGLGGVFIIMVAYAGSALGKLDATRALSLWVNFIGACLILWSLAFKFNLSSVAMEGSWALISLIGLLRLAFKRLAAKRPS